MRKKIDFTELTRTVVAKLGASLLDKVGDDDDNLKTLLNDWVIHKVSKYQTINYGNVQKVSYQDGLYTFIQQGKYNSALRKVCCDKREESEELTLIMLTMINEFANLWYRVEYESKDKNSGSEEWEAIIRARGLWIEVDEKNSLNHSLRDYAMGKQQVQNILGRVNQREYIDKLYETLMHSVEDSRKTSENGLFGKTSKFLNIGDLLIGSRVNRSYHTLFSQEIKNREQIEVYCAGRHTVITQSFGANDKRVFLCFDRSLKRDRKKTITELKMPPGFIIHKVEVYALVTEPFIVFIGKDVNDIDKVYYYGDANVFLPCISSLHYRLSSDLNQLKEIKTENFKVEGVYCGHMWSILIGKDSNDKAQVFACGENLDGQLGLGHNNEEVGELTKLDMPDDFFSVESIACGKHHAVFILKDVNDKAKVFACGSNDGGQLGLKDNNNRNVLTEVDMPVGFSPKSVSCGGSHTVFIETDANNNTQVFVCGDNKEGQLGLKDNNNRNVLTEVDMPVGFSPKSVSCGQRHNVFKGVDPNNNNLVYVCGSNRNRQLGLKCWGELNELTMLPTNDLMETPDSTIHFSDNDSLENDGTNSNVFR